MTAPLLVFVGGGAGAVLRWLVGRLALLTGQAPPLATLAVNLVGCLIMGLVAGWATHRGMAEPTRVFLMTGLLGGFTTFSAFSLDALTLFQRGAVGAALAYAAASLVGATAAVAATPFALIRLGGGNPATVLLMHEGHGGGAAQASGTVNAVDPARHTVNLSHGAIKALGWPAMTMDFPVGPDVDLAAVKPGMRVTFTLIRGGNGQYQVDTLQPATAAAGR